MTSKREHERAEGRSSKPWRKRPDESGIVRRERGSVEAEGDLPAMRPPRVPRGRHVERALPQATMVEVEHRPLHAQDIADSREETSDDALASTALGVGRELIGLAADPEDPLTPTNVLPMLEQIGDHFIADRRTDLLLALVHDLRATFPASDAVCALIRSLTGDKLFTRLVSGPAPGPHATLLELLSFEARGQLRRALAALSSEPEGERRRLLETIVVQFARQYPHELLAHLADAPPRLAESHFRFVCASLPELAADAAMVLALHPSAELQLVALPVLAAANAGPALRRVLRGMLEARSEEVRMTAAILYANRVSTRAFEPLSSALEASVAAGDSYETAAAFGRALSTADRERALELFASWIDDRGAGSVLVGRWAASEGDALCWAAATGLAALLPDPRARELLSMLADGSQGALRRRCEHRLRPAPDPEEVLPLELEELFDVTEIDSDAGPEPR